MALEGGKITARQIVQRGRLGGLPRKELAGPSGAIIRIKAVQPAGIIHVSLNKQTTIMKTMQEAKAKFASKELSREAQKSIVGGFNIINACLNQAEGRGLCRRGFCSPTQSNNWYLNGVYEGNYSSSICNIYPVCIENACCRLWAICSTRSDNVEIPTS